MEKQIFVVLFIFSTVFCLPELDYINVLRAKHNAPPLQYNTSLAKSSNEWAYYLSSITSLVHSSGFIGENLGLIQFNSNSTINIINLWYNEKIKYDYSNPGFTYETGHFTQLIWKNTKSVGFGISLDVNTNYMYMVMQFYPPGNIQGDFANNVLSENLGEQKFTCKCKC